MSSRHYGRDPTATPTATNTTPTAPAQTSVKSEDIATILEAHSKLLGKSSDRRRIQEVWQEEVVITVVPWHVIGTCPLVQQDIEAVDPRNYENKVVLSTGAFVPRTIPGATMRQHPRMALALYQLATRIVSLHSSANSRTASRQGDLRGVEVLVALPHVRQLRTQIIAHRLPPSRFDHIPSATIQSLQRNHPKSQPQLRLQSRQPHPQQSSESNPTCRKLCTCKSMPQHPYAQARSDLCTPSRSESGGPFKAPKDKEPAYRTMAPVQDPRIAEDVFAAQ
ncbi:hypothetical protein A0H81_03286 [Grifola frondosa]|uniref:Uncharacterized protein n=1 Tax=Grifola frondosa TaxID=5627 RepID=A0A1C7MIE5_GRIFR|nr:hypothetical protein A0H81_03286 [Grifola frondosa]